ncbi:MAG TPA: alpha/beta hydrolase [Thiobacillus sp.]|nr:alpha/beta hydrolase [Thiobacillus sp.]
MTKNELIASLAAATGLPKAKAAKIIEAILHVIKDALARGESVKISGLGSFSVTSVAARMGRNPQTGKPIHLAAPRRPTFKAASELKAVIYEAGEALGEVKAPSASRLHSSGSVMAEVPLRRAVPNAAKPRSAGDASKLVREAGEVFVPVHYATNREATGEVDPNEFYGAKRSRKLHYGRLVVSIPKRHQIGRVERPTVWRIWRESPAKHIVLRKIEELDEAEFFHSLAAEVTRLDERTAFVFIHGFNVSFASAAHRAAQMAYDLFLVGEEQHEAMLSVAPILFSWPSKGNPIPYTHDGNNADASVAFLKTFLKDVAQRSGAKSLTVIAHSMGNRLLTTALKEIGLAMQSGEGPIVREIILAAPDIDRDVFEQAAEAVMRTGGRVTLYASDRDKALKASIAKNGYPRAGDASNGVLIIKGMDSIDASEVGEDLLAHSYVGQTSALMDLHAIITRGDSPAKRFGLSVVGKPPKRFWRIRARA